VLIIVLASVVLLAPIVLWAQFGDGDPLHALGVAVGAAILCWSIARRAELRDEAAAETPASRARPSRHAASPLVPRAGHRPVAGAARLSRDVCCSAAEQTLERRAVRRRQP